MARSSSTQPGQAGATAHGGSPATRETARGTCIASFSWGPQHAGSGALAYVAGRPMGSRETPLEPTPRVGFPAKRGGRRRAVVCVASSGRHGNRGARLLRAAPTAATRRFQHQTPVHGKDAGVSRKGLSLFNDLAGGARLVRGQTVLSPAGRCCLWEPPPRTAPDAEKMFFKACNKHFCITCRKLSYHMRRPTRRWLHRPSFGGSNYRAPIAEKNPRRSGGVMCPAERWRDQLGGPGITSGSTSPALFRRS